MGQLKTEKLDNGMIGFECIYGGLEAPFGGIDASKAPRYIDPRCFADASNFLLVDGELCLCTLVPQIIYTPTDITYPLAASSSQPGVLLGVGRLPCENIVKSWALYVSPTADSGNFWNYRLILWDYNGPGTPTIETYNYPVYQPSTTVAAKAAQATLTINYAPGLTAIQSQPEYTLLGCPACPTTPPYAYPSGAGLLYEIGIWNFNVNGIPTSGPPYYGNNFSFEASGALATFTTPASGPATVPTPVNIASYVNSYINSQPFPFTSTINSGVPNQLILSASTPSGYPSVDGSLGNSMNLSAGPIVSNFGYWPKATGMHFDTENMLSIFTNPPTWPGPSFIVETTPFSGGIDGYQIQSLPIQQLTWETVGDVLYLAGYPANYMLKFDNTAKLFTILTKYEGARVLKKMGGHLISVGMIAGIDDLGKPVVASEQHLWFSWTAPSNYGQWNPISTAGLPTGAGGSQLADISDMLTGLVISNSVAFILRAEGLSYAQITQDATFPFDFNHVALCKDGQGCPSTSLWTQYDQLGFYVGGTNIFILQQGPQAIGDKIVETIFPQLIASSNRLSDPPPPFTLPGNPPPQLDSYYRKVNVEPLIFPWSNRVVTQFAVNIGGVIFLYDPQDGTWMKLDCNPIFLPEHSYPNFSWSILKCAALTRNGVTGYGGSYQVKQSYVYGQSIISGFYSAPVFYIISPTTSTQQEARIWFPQEEISFGRDITIDALYVLACGAPGAIINFTIDGWQRDQLGNSIFITGAFQGTLTFGKNATPAAYEEYQVFNSDGSAVTLKSPQLKVVVPAQNVTYTRPVPYPISSDSTVKIVKVAMFGSFDPNQRPV